MYLTLKKLTKKVFPAGYLKRYQNKFRYFLFLFYKGNDYKCNVCNSNLSKFVILDNKSKICPRCSSSPRARQLLKYLLENKYLKDKTVLHFSPNYGIKNAIKKLNTKKYVTSDFEGEFEADKILNLENIDEPDNSYDLILCFHVLEHIEDDKKAIQELFRILKSPGFCLIQTPFKEGDIYEDESIKTKEERLKHFGQNDHVRIYSVDGLIKRLETENFTVEKIVLKNPPNNKYALNEKEIFIKATKE